VLCEWCESFMGWVSFSGACSSVKVNGDVELVPVLQVATSIYMSGCEKEGNRGHECCRLKPNRLLIFRILNPKKQNRVY